ncbi:MAG: hypothetical protein DWI57_18200 [Chloroflexi bacterium]|nr:MAG: hypothetical protein DWI57_18200 [Chloroflexota bacterium]
MDPNRPEWENLPLIKVVGVSAAGKSTLVNGLREQGYNARPASQEHSEMAEMWRKIRPPALLIYLEIDLATQNERRPDVSWDPAWLATETHRLRHARQHADLILNTCGLEAREVLSQVLAWLDEHPVAHASHPLPLIPTTGSSTPP